MSKAAKMHTTHRNGWFDQKTLLALKSPICFTHHTSMHLNSRQSDILPVDHIVEHYLFTRQRRAELKNSSLFRLKALSWICLDLS